MEGGRRVFESNRSVPREKLDSDVASTKRIVARAAMIPRTIHTFWTGKANVVVDACIARMSEANPGWEVVRHADFEEAEAVEGFDALSVQAKVDWLRLCLVERYGGVWLDASVVCHRGVEESFDVSETRVVGFECPIGEGIMENWAFGARPRHPFITAWKREFGRAISMGFEEYKSRSGLSSNAIFEHMPYLTMHGAFVLVAASYPEQVFMRHSLDDAHGPFYFAKKEWAWNVGFVRVLSVGKLFLFDYPRYPPLLKLNGEMRDQATFLLNRLPVLPSCFLRRTLRLRNDAVFAFHVLVLSLVLVVSTALALRARPTLSASSDSRLVRVSSHSASPRNAAA